jgi:predicted nicotinamide N-methyase
LDARRKQKRQAEEQPEDRTDQKEFEVQQQRHLLRIRVFPYHNDVALRLWEAGGFLAEYFVKHPDLVSSKHVIELGAGVGLTGLVLAAICNPASIYLTDYTDVSRRNLQHNLDLNRELLRRQYQFDPSLISQGYLEWNDFSLKLLQSDDSAAAEQRNVSSKIELDVHEGDMGETLAAFQRAEVLIAADVIYDTTVIDSLVCVVRNFLSPSSCDDTQQKVAIFAITRRIIDSFHLFLDRVKAHGIRCTWLASGDDYADFPRIIESTFTQPRKDVQIAQLAIRSGE